MTPLLLLRAVHGRSPAALPDVLVATPSQLLQLLRRGVGAAGGGGSKGKAGGKKGGGGGGGGDGGVGPALRETLHTLVIDEADLLLSYGYGDVSRCTHE